MLRKKRGNLAPNNSSIVLDLRPVMALRRIKYPTAYLLEIGISKVSVNKMLKGQAVQINFRQLTALCLNLNCTPNDLFVRRDLKLPVGHDLEKLAAYSPAPPPQIEDWIKGKSLEELRALLGMEIQKNQESTRD